MCRLGVMTCVPRDGIMQGGAPDEGRRDASSLSRGTYAAHWPHSKDDPAAGVGGNADAPPPGRST
jgi:hypothetical protein